MIEINKVYCCDALELLKQLDTQSVDMILTDPPYAINRDKGLSNSFTIGEYCSKEYNDNWDSELPSKELFKEILRVGKIVIIFGGNYFQDRLPISRSWIIWDKIGLDKQFGAFSDVEIAWTNFDRNISKKYFVKQQGFLAEEKNRFHPTQKPVKLFRNIIEDYTKEGDLILDCFVGSGTTAIACSQIKRNFIVCDNQQKYVDITLKRLEQQKISFFQ